MEVLLHQVQPRYLTEVYFKDVEPRVFRNEDGEFRLADYSSGQASFTDHDGEVLWLKDIQEIKIFTCWPDGRETVQRYLMGLYDW